VTFWRLRWNTETVDVSRPPNMSTLKPPSTCCPVSGSSAFPLARAPNVTGWNEVA
jgi:hypothetical protein